MKEQETLGLAICVRLELGLNAERPMPAALEARQCASKDVISCD